MRDRGHLDVLPKREQARLLEELARLEKYLGGIKNMTQLPAAVYIVDTRKEHIGVAESRKLGLPVVAIVDTNCDPDEIDYPIRGNDDAFPAVRPITSRIAQARLEGPAQRRSRGSRVWPRRPRRPGGSPPKDSWKPTSTPAVAWVRSSRCTAKPTLWRVRKSSSVWRATWRCR